jgi:hypothetical protein
MRFSLMTVFFLIALVPAGPLLAVDSSGLPSTAAFAAADEEAEGMTSGDERPVEALDPRDGDWRVWAGPLLLGIFAFSLVMLIRRYTWGAKNRPLPGHEDSDKDKDKDSDNRD